MAHLSSLGEPFAIQHKIMLNHDFCGAHHQRSWTARLAQLENVDAIPMLVNGFPDSLQHPQGKLFVQVCRENALLNSCAKIEQRRCQPVSAPIVGYIVTDNVLHPAS